mgnify:CR=1 FL=1
MKRKLLYTFITAILLVPLYGVQAMAQDYKLPDNSGTVTMSDILRENPSLKGKTIYGDIKRDDEGNPSKPVVTYGGISRGGKSLLNDADKYGTANPDIIFKKDDINGLTLISNTDKPIEKAKLYLAEYKDNDWWISTTSIILEHQNSAADLNNSSEEASDTTGVAKPVVPEPNPKPFPWWGWLLFGFLSGVVLSFILWKTIVPQTKKTTDEDKQAGNVVKLPTSENKGLNKGDVDQIVNRIAEKHSSELFAKISKLVDEKFINSGSEKRVQFNSSVDGYPVTTAEKRTQNNTIQNVSTSARGVKETRKIQKVETEEFCGYAQLPQNGDFALTLTQDPARTAFVISKRGTDYLVGLIDDEQTLSQLVQPLSDLKANGSNIVDFPEGELQGAQKIVCVDRGIFKEESTGRIVPVKPIQIKRG